MTINNALIEATEAPEFFVKTHEIRSSEQGSVALAYQAVEDDLHEILLDEELYLDDALSTDVKVEDIGVRLYFGDDFSSSTYITFDEILHGRFNSDREILLYSGRQGKQVKLEIRPA